MGVEKEKSEVVLGAGLEVADEEVLPVESMVVLEVEMQGYRGWQAQSSLSLLYTGKCKAKLKFYSFTICP